MVAFFSIFSFPFAARTFDLGHRISLSNAGHFSPFSVADHYLSTSRPAPGRTSSHLHSLRSKSNAARLFLAARTRPFLFLHVVVEIFVLPGFFFFCPDFASFLFHVFHPEFGARACFPPRCSFDFQLLFRPAFDFHLTPGALPAKRCVRASHPISCRKSFLFFL